MGSAQALSQSFYQQQAVEYQQKAAMLGRPRLSAEEMAEAVQRKDDVVASNMFCVVRGAEKLLVKPLPYFREITPHVPTMWERYWTHYQKNRNEMTPLRRKLDDALFVVVMLVIAYGLYTGW